MAIVIDIKAQGMTQANTGIQKFEKSLERILAMLDKVDAKMGSLGAGLSQAASALNSQTMQARGSRRSSVPPKVGMSPMDYYRWFDAMNKASGGQFQAQRQQALLQAWGHYTNRFSSGDMSAMGPIGQLAGPIGAMGKNTLQHKVMQAVMTSRVGIGRGGLSIMPLVGRLAGGSGGGAIGAAGAALLSNPAGLIIAGLAVTAYIAGSALKKLTDMGLKAAAALANLGAKAYRSGAPLSQSGQAAALEAAGIDIGAAYDASMAAGPARGMMAGRGVNMMGGVYGNLNKVQFAQEVFKMIAGAKSEQEAQRISRMFGQTDAMKAFYLRDDQKEFIRKGGMQQDQATIKLGIQTDFDRQKVAMKWDAILVKAQAKLLPLVEKVLNIIDKFLTWLDGLMKKLGFGGTDSPASATEKNTQAINENTRAIKEYRETLGGGKYTSRALPNKIDGFRLDNQALRNAYSTGLI